MAKLIGWRTPLALAASLGKICNRLRTSKYTVELLFDASSKRSIGNHHHWCNWVFFFKNLVNCNRMQIFLYEKVPCSTTRVWYPKSHKVKLGMPGNRSPPLRWNPVRWHWRSIVQRLVGPFWKQECIPVGCVPPAAVAVTGGVSTPPSPRPGTSPRSRPPPDQAPPPLGAEPSWTRHPLGADPPPCEQNHRHV